MSVRYFTAVILAALFAAAGCASVQTRPTGTGGGAVVSKNSPSSCVMVIEVAGAQTQEPNPGRCTPGRTLLMVFTNVTATDYDVSIDTDADFAIKFQHTSAKPLESQKGKANPKAGDVDTIKFKVKDSGQFGSVFLPYTTYKFTVHIKWSGGSYDLDPDIDIPPM